MRPPDRERGAALLTVLLLVAVISVLAATALERVRLATRVAATAGAIGQARGYTVAAEALATIRLTNLLAGQPDRITLAGGWSGRPFPLPVPDGIATAALADGGNCFNLNGLVAQTGTATYAADPKQVQAFARLLRLLGIPSPDQVAAAASDWIDSDTTAQPGGAEDDRYPGYRTGNTLMADPSELRAVAGVTPQVYATLRPWICTLPVARPAAINIDTIAPEQAPLIAALAPGTLGVEQVRSALLQRPALGWATPAEFWRLGPLAGASGIGDAERHTAVKTQWFALRVDAAVGDARVQERALIDATRLPPRLVSRQWGEQS